MLRQTYKHRKKVSITLDPVVVERVAQYQQDAGLPSFSAALEELLWRQDIEQKEKAYYLSMTAQEQGELDSWAGFTTDQFFKATGEK